MNIQDIIIAIIAILFSYSLIPTIIKIIKNSYLSNTLSWQTVIITTIGLFIMAFSMLNLGLLFSFITNLITAICWLIVLILKIKYWYSNER
jgi:uncharacterized protein with PQ loop repeat